MKFLSKAWAAIKAVVKAYPGGLTAVLGVVVMLAAHFGLHVTVAELTLIGSLVIAAVGAVAHTTMVPKTKIPPKA